jgi:hypothetical protein
MDRERFWKAIEDCQGDARRVTRELSKLSAPEIATWHRLYYEHHNSLHRTLLSSAAWVILGECSSDQFHYFKAWVIGKGRKAYVAALEDPDSLGAFLTDDDLEDDCDNEDLNYAAERAFEAKGGDMNELVRNSNEFESPQGPALELASLSTVLPRLTKRFPNWLR